MLLLLLELIFFFLLAIVVFIRFYTIHDLTLSGIVNLAIHNAYALMRYSLFILVASFYLTKLVIVFLAPADVGVEFAGAARLNEKGVAIKSQMRMGRRPDEALCGRNGSACSDEFASKIAAETAANWAFVSKADSGSTANDGTSASQTAPILDSARQDWLVSNNLSANESSAFRGRVFHHYATVLHPYYSSFTDGIAPVFSAQYGAISIMPLYFIRGLSFNRYNALSYGILLVIFTAMFIRQERASPKKPVDTVATLIVFALIAAAANMGAVYIGVGFSVLRYLPICMMIFLTIYRERTPVGILAFTAAALLNSVQFNILFLLGTLFILVVECFVFTLGRKGNIPAATRNLAIFATILACTIAGQYLASDYGSWNFPNTFFASVQEANQFEFLTRFKYGLIIIIVPLLTIDWIRKTLSLEAISRLLRASVFCAIFSAYAFTFPGSPQHYVGYLVLTLPALQFLLSYGGSHHRVAAFFIAILLCLPVIRANYISYPAPFRWTGYAIYEPREYGKALTFRSGNDFEVMTRELGDLFPEQKPDFSSAYFIIREKVPLEAHLNRSLYPSNYDPFSNLLAIETQRFNHYLSRFDYLVAYSPDYIQSMRDYVAFSGGRLIEANEAAAHIALLNHHEVLTATLNDRRRRCSANYCVYRLR